MDSLNAAKKKVNKAQKANLYSYLADPTQLATESVSKSTVTDVSRKLIVALTDLKTAVTTAVAYKGSDREKFFSKLENVAENKMTAVLLMLQFDVQTTYLFWPRSTFVSVSTLFLDIVKAMTILYQELVDRGVPNPTIHFPNWEILYQTMGQLLTSYQQEGGKNATGSKVPSVASNTIQFNSNPTPRPRTAASTPVTVTPVKSIISSGVKSPKIMDMISYVRSSPIATRKQKVTQDQLDELSDVVENVKAQLEVEQNELRDIQAVIEEPQWKKFVKTKKDKRDPQLQEQYDDLLERRSFTKDEVKEISILLKEAERNLATAQSQFDSQPATTKKIQPKSRRTSKRLSFGPGGGILGSPGSPGSGSATPFQISQWKEQERELVAELVSINEQIERLNPTSDAAEIASLETSKTRITTRLTTIETDLTDNNVVLLRSNMTGMGRMNNTRKVKTIITSPWVNPNPPKYVQPYGVLHQLKTIPRRYL